MYEAYDGDDAAREFKPQSDISEHCEEREGERLHREADELLADARAYVLRPPDGEGPGVKIALERFSGRGRNLHALVRGRERRQELRGLRLRAQRPLPGDVARQDGGVAGRHKLSQFPAQEARVLERVDVRFFPRAGGNAEDGAQYAADILNRIVDDNLLDALADVVGCGLVDIYFKGALGPLGLLRRNGEHGGQIVFRQFDARQRRDLGQALKPPHPAPAFDYRIGVILGPLQAFLRDEHLALGPAYGMDLHGGRGADPLEVGDRDAAVGQDVYLDAAREVDAEVGALRNQERRARYHQNGGKYKGRPAEADEIVVRILE